MLIQGPVRRRRRAEEEADPQPHHRGQDRLPQRSRPVHRHPPVQDVRPQVRAE